MELRARLGIGESGEESGNKRRERVRCEVGMRGRGNFATCGETGTGDKAVVLWLGRSCAKTCGHTFESHWIGRDHEVSDSLHRKASCCAVRLGPMDILAPQRGQRQVAS